MNDEQSNPHVLVVDDHREIREALRDYLGRHGFRVTPAADAAQARKVISRSAVDLVVLDIMMPGEDGLSLCRDLRAGRELPVIFLSAMAEETDRIVGLELGADDYLVKPFSPRELLARIRAVLRRAEALPRGRPRRIAERVRFDRWELDANQRELCSESGGVVTLSTAEYALLEVFLTHPGVVLSRDQLLVLARGREAKAYDRSVDIQVSRLRRKLEEDPANPRLIKTDWGGGYYLAAEVQPA